MLLIHGLGYARWGWEPVCRAARASGSTCSRSTTAASAGATRRPGRTRPRRWPATRVQVLDEAGVERAHVVGHEPRRDDRAGARAGEPGAGRPARARLHDAGRRRRYPLPEGTLRLMAEAPTLGPAVALRRFVENALAPATVRAAELVDEIMAHRLATAQPNRAAWAAQAAAGRDLRPADRLGGHRGADARASRRRGRGRRRAKRRAARRADPGRAGGALRRARGTCYFWEQPERFVASVAAFLEGSA